MRKERTTTGENLISLHKNLNSANATPISYKHTKKFIEDGKDPLTFERERLKNNKVDWLLREKRVPAIEADTKLEIEEGKRQFAEHVATCQKIIDIESGELQCVKDMKEVIKKEIDDYEKLYKDLVENNKKNEN